jgi:glycosyltransferase involved in cell wall biosynthesis
LFAWLVTVSRSRQTVAQDLCVIVPSYNHAEFIEEAVGSILSQSVRPAEIRIVDDGSTDRTPAVLERLAASHSGLHVTIRANRGAHATINEGIAATNRPLVAILNSDDRYPPLRFETLLPRIRAEGAPGLVISRVRSIDRAGRPIERTPWYDRALSEARAQDFSWLAFLRRNVALSTSNFLMRKSVAEALGGFRAYRYVHDLDFLVRAILARHGISFVDADLCDYRFHETNTIREDKQQIQLERAFLAARLLVDYGPAITPDARAEMASIFRKSGNLVMSFADALASNSHEYDYSRTPGEPWFRACAARASEPAYAKYVDSDALLAALRRLHEERQPATGAP